MVSDNKKDYQALFKLSPTGIMILDGNGIVLEVNDKICEWLDVKSKEVVGKNIFMLRTLPKESKVVILEKLSQRIEGESVAPYQIKFKGKKGEDRICTVSESPTLNDKGELSEIQVVVSDITNLKKETTSFEGTDAVYREIFENSAVGIMIADEKERITSWNKFTEDLLEKQRDDLYLQPVRSLYPDDEWEKMRALNIRKEGRQSHLETRMFKKNGNPIAVSISISALKDAAGNTTGSIGVIRDITETKVAEEKAYQATDRFENIFENSAVAIMIADEQERIASWNKFTEQLLGKEKDDLYLKPVISLYPEEELKKMEELNIRKEGNQRRLETKMHKKDGTLIDVSISISALKDADGKTTGSIGVIHDITEQKKAEQEMLGAVQMKGQFLSMVSHELRTPLTAIKGSLGILIDEAAGPLNEEQKDFLTTAAANIDRLDRQISDVLDYQRLESRREKFDMKECDVNFVLEEVLQNFTAQIEGKGLTLDIQLDENLPEIMGDESKLTRVFKNLLENAIKFTDEGSIAVKSSLEGNRVSVAVKDTGIGVKKEDIEKLFESFSQISSGEGRKTGSVGLGLVIVRSILRYHGGEVWVESDFGQGSTFTVLLPTQDQ